MCTLSVVVHDCNSRAHMRQTNKITFFFFFWQSCWIIYSLKCFFSKCLVLMVGHVTPEGWLDGEPTQSVDCKFPTSFPLQLLKLFSRALHSGCEWRGFSSLAPSHGTAHLQTVLCLGSTLQVGRLLKLLHLLNNQHVPTDILQWVLWQIAFQRDTEPPPNATFPVTESCFWSQRKYFWWSLEKKTGLQRNDCFYLYLRCQIAYHKDHRSTSSTQSVVSGWSLPLCCREGPEQLVCG